MPDVCVIDILRESSSASSETFSVLSEIDVTNKERKTHTGLYALTGKRW